MPSVGAVLRFGIRIGSINEFNFNELYIECCYLIAHKNGIKSQIIYDTWSAGKECSFEFLFRVAGAAPAHSICD